MRSLAYNEPVTILKDGDDTTLVRFEDGTEVEVPNIEIVSYPTKKRQKAIKPNAKRKKDNFKKHFKDVDRVKKLNALPCCVCGVLNRTQNAHVKSRGAGGTWRDIIPLCDLHHREQGAGNDLFEAKYQINLTELAAYFASTN